MFCRSQWPCCMRSRPWPLGRWDCGFKSRLRHHVYLHLFFIYSSSQFPCHPITDTTYSSYWKCSKINYLTSVYFRKGFRGQKIRGGKVDSSNCLLLIFRIREVPVSNLGPETDPDCYFSWFFSVPQEKCGYCLKIRQRPLRITSFPIHHSHITPSLDAT
jgi:hypothetical protein